MLLFINRDVTLVSKVLWHSFKEKCRNKPSPFCGFKQGIQPPWCHCGPSLYTSVPSYIGIMRRHMSMADSQKVVSAILGKIELMTPRTSPEMSPLCHNADLP